MQKTIQSMQEKKMTSNNNKKEFKITEKIKLAMEMAKNAHEGSFYSGKDYFDYHVMNVYHRAIKMAGDEIREKVGIVAILHDTVEDHDLSLGKIEKYFGKDVADAVGAVSFRKNRESRQEYYERVYSNELARIVKIADASENKYNSELDKNASRSQYYNKIVKKMSI